MGVRRTVGIVVLSALMAGQAFAAADGVLDPTESARASTLAGSLSSSLGGMCPGGSERDMLAAIASALSGQEIEVVAATLTSLSQNSTLCDNAKAAIASANQAAQLALASFKPTGATTGAGSGLATFGFSTGSVGAPGGGGGSVYITT